MHKIRLNKDTEINKEVIEYILKSHKVEKDRVEKLNRYYEGKSDILNRKLNDPKKPNNKLVNSYASYITNMAVGYFLGSPISYKYHNERLRQLLDDTFRYNDENDINTTLAKQASIQGYAVELMYSDSDARPRFKPIKASEVALVYDNTLEENLMYAVRYYDEKDIKKDEKYTVVEVYSKDKITNYIVSKDDCKLVDENVHFFGDVPVNIYVNNDENMGDFERVLSLIDAYDKTQSDSANDFEYFTNCMLVVSGYVLSEEDAQSISDMNTLNFADNEGKAEYLIKNIQDNALENYKNRLDADIHKFSQIPNMSDESFGNNSSGISLQFKLMGIENITSVKESKFRKGLMRRIELLCNFLNIKTNGDMTYLDAEPIFTRTKPINELEMAQMMQTLTGILSEESILALSPFVDDVQSEMERKNKEANSLYEDDYENLGVEDGEEE